MDVKGIDTESVLVVDDLQSNLELMEAILLREGYRPLTALSAYQAIEVLDNTPVDMAILDVMMPGMNGYELCRRLKEKSGPRFFPIILVTALQDMRSKILGLEAGADDFISKPFNTLELLTRVRSLLKFKKLQEELEHSEDIILTLAVALEAKDHYTKGHSERVGRLSEHFGRFIDLSPKEQFLLKKAGILHDIGKIGIDENILHKAGPLVQEEINLVKRHAIVGEEICRPLRSVSIILPVIRHHHERWDGHGFPDGLKGEEIPLMARIIAITDSFDAMVSERPYRGHLSLEDAIKRMEAEMFLGQWDPQLLKGFIEMMKTNGSIWGGLFYD